MHENEIHDELKNLMNSEKFERPNDIIQNPEAQQTLDNLRNDAALIAKSSPNDRWVLQQELDQMGFPKITLNTNDNSITAVAGLRDGARTIKVTPDEIEVTDIYGQKGYSSTYSAKKTF